MQSCKCCYELYDQLNHTDKKKTLEFDKCQHMKNYFSLWDNYCNALQTQETVNGNEGMKSRLKIS